ARHLTAAAVLRQGLRPGEPCPVCEHPVAEHPPALATPAVDAVEQRLEGARRAETRLRGLADKAAAVAAEARAAALAEQQNLNQHAARHASAVAEVDTARASLAER